MEKTKSKKIIFVEPRGSAANVFSSQMTLPLLGPIYLATMLKNEGYDARVHNENLLGRDVAMHELDADILCITGLTSTISRGYEIAKDFKALNPERKVIIGGIHASFMKEEAAKYADNVVIGEGENAILDLIKNGSSEKFIHSSQLSDLSSLPMPDFTVLKNYQGMGMTPIMTSRGCPFGCNFCSVTALFGRKYRTNSAEQVIKEFRNIKTKTAFFYDDNLCADRQRSYEIFNSIAKENLGIKWSAQVRCDAAQDNRLLKKMADAGCDRVFIGFESVNQRTLDGYKKNQSLDDIVLAIKRFHEYGIKIHGMFVLGSDKDDKSIFNATNDFSNAQDIDSVQYSILTPLPGTPVYNMLAAQKRLLHRVWEYYDGMHVVFRPKLLSPLELQQGIIDSYKKFYTSTKLLKGALNLFYDKTINRFSSAIGGLKTYAPKNWDTTLLGKVIISRWLNLNKSYLDYLKRIKTAYEGSKLNIMPKHSL
ncbi:B12-binding domain-containing radical SAM protein [Candidatus Woesearchaeota archaeon]|nr:B12-binding domain-containing radical SAM protein [Candidatus Woesearchaeota archaeon]